MAINCYWGLMGTGKTYEVVTSVVIPALAAGRRVVTNISGIDVEHIRAYAAEKHNKPLGEVGEVVLVTDEQVKSPDFLPDSHALQAVEYKAIVLPGDLVAIDEAYKIWGREGCDIPMSHKVFFREHRHYTHPDTGVSCDLVLMTQDIDDLHRTIKVVIEVNFKTHKAKGVGLNNVYTVTMWEGYKHAEKHIVKDWTQTYDVSIFPLYKSYAGQQQGKESQADKRQNILADRRMRLKVGFMVVASLFAGWRAWHFFSDRIHFSDAAASELRGGSGAVPAAGASPSMSVTGASARPSPDLLQDWRIVGTLDVGGVKQVILAGAAGVRMENAIFFSGSGLALAGVIDGRKVTRFGLAASSQASTGQDSKKYVSGGS